MCVASHGNLKDLSGSDSLRAGKPGFSARLNSAGIATLISRENAFNQSSPGIVTPHTKNFALR